MYGTVERTGRKQGGGQKCTRRDTICVPLLNKIDCGDVLYKTLFDEMFFPVAFVYFSELDGGELDGSEQNYAEFVE